MKFRADLVYKNQAIRITSYGLAGKHPMNQRLLYDSSGGDSWVFVGLVARPCRRVFLIVEIMVLKYNVFKR